ncbi:C-X-C motif chemokine 11-like [Latimeria chalumnae]|uniref:C-X-C motif chemokine 11-like n=1 Tax=Latimeria chalumnae TaxID=7897 RepID=UPI0006D90EAF|nr:PREDICTED: C-X-C motif chemokine 11-like [Latimeria chalumnae]|eukprot:XP_014348613.1 PREDICTED: C-X-C motif chemokine 11-like [Latimeria chalumnae]
MKGTAAAVILALILSAIVTEGLPALGRGRCLCTAKGLPVVPRRIEKLEVFPPSTSCEKLEVIATVKAGKKTCLNPNSKRVQSVLAKIAKKGASQ